MILLSLCDSEVFGSELHLLFLGESELVLQVLLHRAVVLVYQVERGLEVRSAYAHHSLYESHGTFAAILVAYLCRESLHLGGIALVRLVEVLDDDLPAGPEGCQ